MNAFRALGGIALAHAGLFFAALNCAEADLPSHSDVTVSGISATDMAARRAAAQRIFDERKEVIAGFVALARSKGGAPLERDDPRLNAIALLGEYSAETEESLEFLIKNIDLAPPGIKNPRMEEYPCAAALIKIGGPAAERAAIRLVQRTIDDKSKLSCDLLIYVINQVEGDEIGELLIEKMAKEGRGGMPATLAFLLNRAAELRQAKARAGQVEQIDVLGLRDKQKMLPPLATEYVRAKAVVQVGYSGVDSDVAAVGGFLGGEGKQALLLLNDRPSMQALSAQGEKWEKVKPTEYLIAARGAAIIVNPANQLAALTQDQVRGVFKGEIADWGILGGTGLAASGKKAPITAYGLPAGDPVSAILQQEGVLVQSHQVTAKKDSAEVLAAVAADSQGIGVVDLAALPVGDKSVRVLAIQIGTGNKAELVPPTPDNLKNAMYPYAQRVYLYVHPQASDAAKDFAKFVATCGAAEATPYADTLKTTMDAYRKNGLISLAEAAIDRAAKEAFDAAKAEPAKAEAKKK